MSSSLKVLAQKYPRRYGAFMLLLGAGLLYWQLYLPVQYAQQHAANIAFFPKAIMAGGAVACFGLLQMVFGRTLIRTFEPSAGGSKVASYILGFAFAGLGFYTYHSLNVYLGTLGYQR